VTAPTWLLLALLGALGPATGEEPGEAPAPAQGWEAPARVDEGEEVEPAIDETTTPAEPEPASEPEPAVEPEPELVADAPPQPEPDPPTEPEGFIDQPTTPRPSLGPEPKPRRGPQPPVYGPILVTGGLGLGPGSVGLGLGFTGFPIPYLGIGLDLDDTVYFGDGVFNEFAATPHLWVIALPYRSVTPYVRGGFGVDVFSHQLGVYGIWKAAGGVVFRFGRAQRVAIRAGLEVIGRVSDNKFGQNFQCGLVDRPCSLRLRPEIGVGLRFGGRR